MDRPGSADEVVDELVPTELDWRHMVRTYPAATLVLAAVGGYVLGSRRGKVVVMALSTWAADAVAANINEILGEDVL